MEKSRQEYDLLGVCEVDNQSLWGVHTQRALENFSITGQTVARSLIHAYAIVKQAACQSNYELKYLSEQQTKAIIQACLEIQDGLWDDHFPIDVLQGGAGTATNMNVNEVIAQRASQILSSAHDKCQIHPLDHVNLHQSTNDTFPTALKVAALVKLKRLSENVAKLQGAFQRKEKEFSIIVKMGRTQCQMALPMTLGAEFGGFAEAIARDRWRTFKCEERLRVINLGGTAIGTGLGAPRAYIFMVTEKLRLLTGLSLARAENMVEATAHQDAFVEVSGILKAHASNLLKICSDLRQLQTLGQIRLPEMAVGSSIMPGKINPIILEAVMQVAISVFADDMVVTESVSRGTLQINEFMPLLAHSFLSALDKLIAANAMLADHVNGIVAITEQCQSDVDQAETMITAFLPSLGYRQCEKLLLRFRCQKNGYKNLRVFLEEQIGYSEVDRVLSPQNITALGFRHDQNR